MTQNETPDISQEQVIIPAIVQEAATSAQLGDIPNFAVFRKLVEAMLQRY